MHSLVINHLMHLGQFVNELVKLKIPVTYILYPDEGHGFGRPQNSLAEAGFVERFLHKCLHGRYEKFSLGQYNSSAIVRSYVVIKI